jgi:drug/metabolite transporter (DMT)-like permease
VAVVLGLVAALCWGGTDFLARFAGRAVGIYRSMFFSQTLALVVVSVWLAADPAIAARAATAPISAWLAGLLCAPINLAATFAMFRGLMTGKLGMVSPVTASYGAVTAVLCAAGGEALGAMTAAGIAASVAGVALASAPARRPAAPDPPAALRATPSRSAGIGWALAASLGYGVGFWLQGVYAVPFLGSIVPVWLYYVVAQIFFVLLSYSAGRSLRPPPLRALPVVLGSGTLSITAYLAFSIGLGTGEVAVVTVITSLGSAVAALLGRVVLGERLARHQWTGIAAIIAGLALINGAR